MVGLGAVITGVGQILESGFRDPQKTFLGSILTTTGLFLLGEGFDLLERYGLLTKQLAKIKTSKP